MNPQLYERLYGLRWIMLVGLVAILIIGVYIFVSEPTFLERGGTQVAAQITETSIQPLASDQIVSSEASLSLTPTPESILTITPIENTPTTVITPVVSVTEPAQTPTLTNTPEAESPTQTMTLTFTPVVKTPTQTVTSPVETDDISPGAVTGDRIDVYFGHCGVFLSNAYSGINVEIMPEDDPSGSMEFIQTPCKLEMFDSAGNEISRYDRILYKYININEQQLRMWLDGGLTFYLSDGFLGRKCDAYLVRENDYNRLVCINGDVGLFGLVGNSTE